jgi:glucosyl-3-phosphoglycerate phosphatase
VTSLILWRHGHTEWNSERRVQGHTDTPLSDLGRTQATEAAALLAARDPVAIVASDLRRCADTAAALAALTGLPVRHDARLRERYYGEWEGLTMPEIAQRWPESYARKTAGADAADLGHGIERPVDVMKRVGEALREAVAVAPDGVVVAVSHGGSARYGMFELLGWPVEQLRGVHALVNCHYSELRLDPDRGWLLHAHNVGVAAGPPGYE